MGLDVQLPAAADIEPQIYVDDFNGVQPYKIVMVGEKSSLEPVLSPIAESYKADLYLPTGCLSDALIYQTAKIGADDGRPMVVFYFSDCDPSGWNMPAEVGRKLQAFKALEFPDLHFKVGLYVARASGYVSRREMPRGSIGGTLLTVGVVERRSEEQSPRLEALPRSLP